MVQFEKKNCVTVKLTKQQIFGNKMSGIFIVLNNHIVINYMTFQKHQNE